MKISDLGDAAPEWLRDADTRDADIYIDDGRVVWRGGTWLGGTWHDGTWHGGTWLGGTWHGGTWRGGTWHGGTWLGGVCDVDASLLLAASDPPAGE